MATEQEEIPENIAAAITEISEHATLLIRDEIDLAKAEIATKLYLSEGTVRNYLSSAIAKTAARNRIDALRIADERGWL